MNSLVIVSLTVIFFFSSAEICLAANNNLLDGVKLTKAGQFQKALEFLDRGVDDDPTNSEMHYWRGKCLGSLGKKTDALAEFKLAALLASDTKTKELCRIELARSKVAMPKGNVNSPDPTSKATKEEIAAQKAVDADPDTKKYFKLSSKKLDWNLQLRGDFIKSMNERTQNLGKLAMSNNWRMPRQVSGNVPNFSIEGALKAGPPHRTAPLTAEEKSMLSGSDIVIILDHSGSMQARDCPAGNGAATGRLAWCVEELESLTRELYLAMPHGFHIIPFDSKPEVHRVNSPQQLHQVLSSIQAGGGTDLTAALQEAFRVHTAHPQQPLLIAVVSDAEIEVHSCEQTIVEATRRFPLPNGVFITLLQIGYQAELHTADQLSFLDNLDRHAAAAYDAFNGIPFSKVRADGFGKDLLLGLRARLNRPDTSASATSSVPASSAVVPAASSGAGSAVSSGAGTAANSGAGTAASSGAGTAANSGVGTTVSSPGSSSVNTVGKTTAKSTITNTSVQPQKNSPNSARPNAADPPPLMWPAGSAGK